MRTPADNRAENTPLPLAKSMQQPTFSYSYILLVIILLLLLMLWPAANFVMQFELLRAEITIHTHP